MEYIGVKRVESKFKKVIKGFIGEDETDEWGIVTVEVTGTTSVSKANEKQTSTYSLRKLNLTIVRLSKNGGKTFTTSVGFTFLGISKGH